MENWRPITLFVPFPSSQDVPAPSNKPKVAPPYFHPEVPWHLVRHHKLGEQIRSRSKRIRKTSVNDTEDLGKVTEQEQNQIRVSPWYR